MKVSIVKIGKYDPTINDKYSRYHGYCLSTVQESNPSIISNWNFDSESINSNTKCSIFHSTLKRGTETAALLYSQHANLLIPTPELNEIPFSLKKMVTSKEFEKHGSDIVRKRFVEFFIKDELLESRESIKQRIKDLFNKLNKSNLKQITCVSHSFIMKIIESIANKKDPFKYPETLIDFIPYNQKTYDFGKGFQIEI